MTLKRATMKLGDFPMRRNPPLRTEPKPPSTPVDFKGDYLWDSDDYREHYLWLLGSIGEINAFVPFPKNTVLVVCESEV